MNVNGSFTPSHVFQTGLSHASTQHSEVESIDITSHTFLNLAQKPVRPEQGIPVEAGSQTQVARRAKGGLVK